MISVGEYIRRRRTLLDLKQAQLAERLRKRGYDYNSTSIVHWETGRHNPPMWDGGFVLALIEALEDEPLHFFAEIGYLGENEIAEFLRRTSTSDREFLLHFFRLLGGEPQNKE